MQKFVGRSQTETNSRVGGIPLEGKRVARSAQVGQVEEELINSKCPFINNKKLNILYTNADCFTNKRDDLSILFGTLDYRPSLIVITEVNSKSVCNNLLESDYTIFGYKIYSINVSVQNQRGIIVYVDSSLNSCQLMFVEEFV